MYSEKKGKYREIGRGQRNLMYLLELIRRGWDAKFYAYRLKWNLAPALDIVTDFPTHVDIEVTDACNLKCIMCVHGYENDLVTGLIRKDFAMRLIDEAAENGVYSVKFNWRGEPLIHRDLEFFVAYAKEKGIPEVQFNTNGLLLNPERIRRLITAGLDRIIFSMDGATQGSYEKIRVGGNFERLMENIRNTHEIRREMGATKPFIRIQMVRMKENATEVSLFQEMWREIVDDIRFSDVTDRGQGDHLQVGDQVAVGRSRCPQPWQRLVVSWDGKVHMCCGDWFQHQVVGDASRESLKAIWHGERMAEMRQIQRELRLNEIQPCNACYVKESYQWEPAAAAAVGEERSA